MSGPANEALIPTACFACCRLAPARNTARQLRRCSLAEDWPMFKVQQTYTTSTTCWLLTALFLVCAGGCFSAEDSEATDMYHGSIVVDGASLQYTVEGSGYTCLIVGSRKFHRQMFSLRFKEHFRCAYGDTRMFTPGALAPPDRPYDLTTMVEDLEAVRRDLGWERVVVVGHSLFAWVALEYARTYADRTDGVVMIAAPPEFPGVAAIEAFMDADASVHRKSIYAEQQKRWEAWLNAAERSPDEQLLQYFVVHSAIYWYDPEFDSAAFWEGVVWDSGLFNEVLAHSTDYHIATGPPVITPAFVAQGRYDYRVPYTLWDAEAKAALERLSFHLFEESGHQPPLEEPDAFDAAVIRWFDARIGSQ